VANFNINSLTPIKVKKGKSLFKNDSVEFFRDNEAVVEALSQAILEGDKDAFHEIISGYLSVVNKEELSRRSKVPIATIRRMAAGANFNVDNMLKVTFAINKELVA
jgi:predicted transcriptional regulator